MADISITGQDSYEIESLTEEGAAWMWSNVSEAEVTLGGGVVVAYIDGPLYAWAIAEGAIDEGIKVEVNGLRYATISFPQPGLGNSFLMW